MSRVWASVVGQGSMIAAEPDRLGFWPVPAELFCHTHHSRSMFAWCIKNNGSAGAVGTDDIEPPTHTWIELWTIPSSCEVNVANALWLMMLGTFEAMPARSEAVPGERVTGIVCVGVMMVGVKATSQPGTDSSPGWVQ